MFKKVVDLFKSSRSFKAFKGSLAIGDFATLEAKSRKKAAFANLEALEIINVWPTLMRRMALLAHAFVIPLHLQHFVIITIPSLARRRCDK